MHTIAQKLSKDKDWKFLRVLLSLSLLLCPSIPLVRLVPSRIVCVYMDRFAAAPPVLQPSVHLFHAYSPCTLCVHTLHANHACIETMRITMGAPSLCANACVDLVPACDCLTQLVVLCICVLVRSALPHACDTLHC